jgi:hypothetical protein
MVKQQVQTANPAEVAVGTRMKPADWLNRLAKRHARLRLQ